MLELKNTVTLMNSEFYKDRFIAEYIQTKLRYERLKTFNQKIEVARLTGVEEPRHDCPLDLLKNQQRVMGEYLHILEIRAKIEHINLQAAIEKLELSVTPIPVVNGTPKPENIPSEDLMDNGDTDGDNKLPPIVHYSGGKLKEEKGKVSE